MGAVWLVFGVKLRRYWRSWLLLALLIAIVSGFALAATAAARRTDAAFPGYVACYGDDAIVYTDLPLPQLARQPGVTRVVPVQMPFYGQPRCSCGHQFDVSTFAVREVTAADLHQVVKLVSGRMPDPSSPVEGLASFTLEQDYGVHPGTVITMPMAAASQWPAIRKALAGAPPPKPTGPVIAVRIVGIVAAGAAAVATLLSPLAPAGEARLADPAPGLAFDGAVLGLGALATMAVVLVLGVLPALRGAWVRAAAGRVAARRPSAVADAVADAGAPAGAAIGVRYALDPGRGTRAVPVRTALAGSVAAVAAVCATVVFGTSLAHLTATPALYGAPFQMYFPNSGPGGTAATTLLSDLEHDRRIGQITLASVPDITVNHVVVRAFTGSVAAGKGPLLMSVVQGRLPSGDDQVAFGVSTMRRTGARIGAMVPVTVTDPSGASRTRSFRVVGELVFPGDFGTGSLGTGAAVTTAGYVAAQCPPAPAQAQCLRAAQSIPPEEILVRAVDGPAGQAALAHYGRLAQGDATRPVVPAALVNFGESANFPLLLGDIVTLCGLATLAHLLVVSVARRRTENGLLRALGMVRRQLASIVFWQATTVAVIAIVLGIPIGIAVGQAIWRAFAVSLVVVPALVVHAWPLAAVAAGVLVTANVLAAIPALGAARTRPGRMLRAE